MAEPILQVALDLIDLPRALRVAKEAIRGGAQWLEAGTPLIKSEGLNAVRALKRSFPKHTLVADMKTMDTGAFEVEMAAKAGADVIIILGAATNETIKEAIRAAKKYGSEIMVDLMNLREPAKRAKEVEKFGADYLCAHVGIDQQMIGIDPIKELQRISKSVNIPIAAAGGINSETAPEIVNSGANIVIVGGAIIKAENAEDATKKILESIKTLKPVKTKLFKKYSEEEIFEALLTVSTPNVSDAMHRKGTLKGIKQIIPATKMVGKALTVLTMRGDWAKTVEAIDQAKEKDVIVIDSEKSRAAVWGELATISAIKRGVCGVVIDGAVRDVEDIREMKFPVFARYVSPHAGEPKGFGEINVEIKCGGVIVRPGDIIFGDDNGVVAIPKERAVEIVNRAIDVRERENRIREEIKRGSTLGKVLRLKKWEKIG